MGQKRIINFPGSYEGSLFENADGSPRLWWVDDLIWVERELITTVSRLVEDHALLNIWLEARALRSLHLYRWALNGHEEKILHLELRCLRENPHYTPQMRYEWIAERMNGSNYTPRQVKAILDDVTDILRRAEMVRVLEVMEQAKSVKNSYFKGLVIEVVRERGRVAIAA